VILSLPSFFITTQHAWKSLKGPSGQIIDRPESGLSGQA
jgi:hypothetical protein